MAFSLFGLSLGEIHSRASFLGIEADHSLYLLSLKDGIHLKIERLWAKSITLASED